MNHKKNDRRTNRTRRYLKESLLSLILEKGYDAITIEEITERADLGRTTFYLHYRDKEDLLLESIDEMVDDLVRQVSQIPLSTWKMQAELEEQNASSPSPVRLIFQHAADNAQLYRVILRGEGANRASTRMRLIIVKSLQEFVLRELNRDSLALKPEIPLDVFANYFAGALLGFITWWLESDVPYTPAEMAFMFQKIFIPGANRVLGVSTPPE